MNEDVRKNAQQSPWGRGLGLYMAQALLCTERVILGNKVWPMVRFNGAQTNSSLSSLAVSVRDIIGENGPDIGQN